ncbi:sulfite exporter TauE/SafE family protein [Sphingomonas sp. NSE70-1]|uniref:Probable membrane transporter protein n=1 Tax=Sphingomonas caseinilyticus TaxID=2908205 RepID=A0ABT0RSI4_9SPHN|nr:sulfite exporter TauE/SafE family protein [Sphingomonas caseinilyticus]MCL6697916.1 sulfite exporter TauE/SafE family protein [Sphingomonas caseinilyticus]
MLIALLIPLTLAGIICLGVLIRAAIRQGAVPKVEAVVLGAVVSFFDTLGIGSFAPTAAWFKLRKLVPDRLIPQTMLVGLTPPAVLQGIIYLILLGVMVDAILLVGCILAFVMGGLLGAPMVAKSKVWVVQTVVAIGLLLAAGAYALTNLNMMPGGGTANSLPMDLTVLAIVASFIFGVLLNFGVGNYAPTLVLLSLMGMDPRLCFPIMAASAGLMGSAASVRHIRMGQMDLKVVLGITLGGFPAVLVAAFLVKEMPVETLRWLVIIVVLYAAAVMARSAWQARKGEETPLTPEAAAAE